MVRFQILFQSKHLKATTPQTQSGTEANHFFQTGN